MFTECVLTDCSFEKLHTKWSPLAPTRSIFRDCRFDRARLKDVMPGDATFERCSFRAANLNGWFTHSADLVDCVFSGVMRDVTFFGSFDGRVNAFRGNDFSAADLVGVGFRFGIDLAANRLPAGDNYVLLDRVGLRCRWAREQVDGWADTRAQQHAFALLSDFEKDAVTQDPMYLRLDEPFYSEVTRGVHQLLLRAPVDAAAPD